MNWLCGASFKDCRFVHFQHPYCVRCEWLNMSFVSTDSSVLSFPSDSRLIFRLSMTNALPPALCCPFASPMVLFFPIDVGTVPPDHLTADALHRLILLHNRVSRIPQSLSFPFLFLKQDHGQTQDSTWSSKVRRRSRWRVPVAMDRVEMMRSKMMPIRCRPLC